MNIPVVYEDDWLLVVDKPSGLLTIPAPNKGKRTLIRILNEDSKDRGKTYRLHACHRLDRQTSGLIIFAKGKSVQKKMMQAFKEKKVSKAYLALVNGVLPKNQDFIRNPIGGKQAVTGYRVLHRYKGLSVVKIHPLTGRKNQIRIHFKLIGHAVVGEDKFAFRKDFIIKARRLCLHAQGLDFLHPVTKKRINLEAGVPEYFEKFVK